MTLTIKLGGNWNSFQLANSAPPLSVTDSALAPSARILHDTSWFTEFQNGFWGAMQPTTQLSSNFNDFWPPIVVQLNAHVRQCCIVNTAAQCWQSLASKLPLEKFCYGWLHRRLLRRYRPQSAVNCSTLWERAAGSSPNTSQVSLLLYYFTQNCSFQTNGRVMQEM